MTQAHTNQPTAVLCMSGRFRSGFRPAASMQANNLDELYALPAQAGAWQQQHPGSEISGVISYDAGLLLQGMSTRHGAPHHPLAQVYLFLPDQVLNGPPSASHQRRFSLDAPLMPDITRDEYLDDIARIHRYEHAGDCYQVNYARRFSGIAHGSAFSAWQHLASAHPAPWSSYIGVDGGAIFGASPECFLSIHDGRITSRPIKGSRPRGTSAQEDAMIGEALVHSSKDRAENLMIVDLLRNDLGRISRPGTVQAFPLFELQRFSNVQHLVSTVSATLTPDTSPLAALLACFPGGSITGAPKRRAMEIIDEMESFSRGYYCGTQFWIDSNGNLDANILIRTFQWFGNTLSCHGGGGIVADSNAEAELAESDFKVRALMEALN